jgi:serine/threonine protein kinase
MIQQLCLFSHSHRRTLRLYDVCRDDIVKLIEKARRRPRMMIETDDINLQDPNHICALHIKMKKIIGLFHIQKFIVRVEHAFDNSQIASERYVVSQLINHGHAVGIDSQHHVVVPVCIQMNAIDQIPPSERTIFHHISYSIQPMVFNTQTIDVWYRHNRPSNAITLHLCWQMAKAIVHLHQCDIVHGDIKPANTLVSKVLDRTGLTDSDSGSGSGSGSESESEHGSGSVSGSYPNLYVIDYGMSGPHATGEGTGGTKPYCAPETGNGSNKNKKYTESYNWIKIHKEYDMWSFGLLFFTMFTLGKCISHAKQYPSDFFDESGYITDVEFAKIGNESMRALFRRTLCPVENRITAIEFMKEIDEIYSNMTR